MLNDRFRSPMLEVVLSFEQWVTGYPAAIFKMEPHVSQVMTFDMKGERPLIRRHSIYSLRYGAMGRHSGRESFRYADRF